ncbi:MAG: cation:proton antiporter [Mariprofundaceae bacterium]|nr:cation:proton antiporter [Mariprofundaceae bacterium]
MIPLSESILILMALLAMAMAAAPLMRYIPIPFSAFLVGIGISVGAASHLWPPLHIMQYFQLTPELVLFVFLPALIFESGYNLDARQLIKDIFPILVLAVPALLLATLIVGFGLHYILSMPLALALLFGALISATDPVAVISLFRELGAPLRLTVLVEGESLFNDATAIVVVNILLAMVLAGGIDASGVFGAGGKFLYVFFGGAVLGLILGLFFSEWMRLLSGNPSGILVLSIILAYVSFITAEHFLHISGVMAVVGASLCLGVYGITRIPHHAGEYLRESWEFLAYVSNALLFLLVGLSINLQSLSEHFLHILLAIALVLLSRIPSVYILLPLTLRSFHLPQVKMSDKHIMWWGGLKGGLAIAIVLSLPEDLPLRQLLLDMTLGVVLFTLLINAPTIKPFMNKLGLNALNDDELVEFEQSMLHAREHAYKTLQNLKKAKFMSCLCEHHAQQLIGNVMQGRGININSQQQLHHVRQIATRAELEALESLRDAGLVSQYVLVDIKSELRLEREAIGIEAREMAHNGRKIKKAASLNPVLKLEQRILRGLRERDWMAKWLAYYQGLRFAGSLRRSILRILMADAAISHLKLREDIDDEARGTVVEDYTKQLKALHAAVKEVRNNFPDFFSRFEAHMGMQVALAAAHWQIDDDYKHGETGKKAHNCVENLLKKAKSSIPTMKNVQLALPAKDLIRMVPMFAPLSEEASEILANQATVVTFLPEDTVIEEGEKGDALYIISSGTVEVSHLESNHQGIVIAELRAGDFFGEMALLGDQVRLATVVAKQASTLLRLTRSDVLGLAQQHKEVQRNLERAEENRKQLLAKRS